MNVVQPSRGATPIGLDADSHGTERRAIVDTHRHPIGPKLAAKMAERGFYDPKQEFPQTNAQDLIGYREFYDLEYAMPKAREEGVTLCLASNGGEVEWFARDLLKVSTGDALKILNDEYLEIRDNYPGEFALMANAHALEENCRPIVEEMLCKGGAKAIAVASSYGDGADRTFLDSPKAEWLWEFAAANDIVVHIHPPMLSVGHEVLMQYRLNEAVGRPFDSTVNGARMIASGLFDRHPKLQVLIVHMGGELASVLGRLEFNWRLNYKGIRNPPAGKPYKNKRSPSDYFKTNILVDCMGFNPIGLRAAVEMCGVDRVVFGSDYGPIPYGIEEHVGIVEDVLASPADRDLVFWKTSNRIFRLGLFDRVRGEVIHSGIGSRVTQQGEFLSQKCSPMFTAEQYRTKVIEYAKLMKTANGPNEVREYQSFERSFTELADNAQWVADNYDKTVHPTELGTVG